ncbi:hypothetical protein Tco_1223665 [Tanacetum coccineum]
MKSSRKSQAGVIIKDTPGVSVSKKKALAKGKRSKGIEILSDVALTELAQLKEISSTDEGTGTKPGVLDVPKYDSKSEKESWGDSEEEEDDDDDDEDDTEDESDNDDDDDNDGNDGNDDDDDNDGNDDDGDNNDNDDDSDHERTKSDRDENPNLNQSSTIYDEEEVVPTHDEEKINDEEKMDEEEDDEVTKELYKDVNVNLGNKDVDMTDVDKELSRVEV